MSKRRRPTAIDLFAGAGGLSVGLKSAQFNVKGAIENDPLASEAYQLNHPAVHVWTEDIRKVTAIEVKRTLALRRGTLDLLAGCPPCQGFSTTRNLNGGKRILDKQNDLIFQFLKFVRVLRPKMIMLENVPRLARNQRLRVFRKALRACGYECAHRIVDASDHGVPQRRRRLIFLASRIGAPSFPEPFGDRVTVRDAIKGLPKPGDTGDALHDIPERRSAHVKAIIAHIPKNGGSRRDAPKRFTLPCHRRIDGFYDIYGRMNWDDVAPTITSGCHNPSKGRFLHPAQNRAITLREAALLQTFPRRYKFPTDAGKEQLALLIGNALPPKLIARTARPLAKSIREYRRRRR